MKLKFFPERQEFNDLTEIGNLIPVCQEILADTETPLSALAKINEKGCSIFLLESVEGGERWGRYSFLGKSSQCSIKIYRNRAVIEEEGCRREVTHGDDPLGFLRSFMSRFKPVQLPELPRFWGGLVGYIAYETVSFFEKIPNTCSEEALLAHFVIPDQLFIFDNIRHTLTLVAYAMVENGDRDAAYGKALTTLREMERSLSQPLPPFESNDDVGCVLEESITPEDFRSQVSKVKEYISAGDVIQTVLSQPFSCSAPSDAWSLYRAQRYINPSPYLYFLQLDDLTLVGSSPEAMVRLENGIATLRPIAGTRPRGKTEQADRSLADELLQDPKERAEHLMLVDLGRNDLGRVAEVGTVQVTDLMVVERYSHVMHLVSNIVCDLRSDCDAWDLLRATFPAGTLTGAPKIRAMEIIAELESSPRGPYGGAIGYVSFTGNMDLAITIRTACIKDGILTVRAGAGIVADSNPEKERQETVNKAKAIQKALQLISENASR